MPATSKSKNPRGVEIVFTEADHKYLSIVNGKEINYTSVTGLVGSCFPQFDPTGAIAERCAKKEGITVAELKEETPLQRLGTPKNIADAVAFLVSDKAEFITGQVLAVNGGFVI